MDSDHAKLDAKAHWEHVYSTRQDSEVSWFEPLPQTSLEMLETGGLKKDARIIDVGGGSSRLAAALLNRGYTNITVLDIAEAALSRARLGLGPRAANVHWIAADITHWQPEAQPEAQYDAWHDRAVFHFLTHASDRAKYRAALTTAVAPGGRVVLATFAPEGPERCSGLPVQRYTPEQLAQELGSGFQWQQSLRVNHPTPGGAIQAFQFSSFRRVEQNRLLTEKIYESTLPSRCTL